mgnify:CR=1 FL=1
MLEADGKALDAALEFDVSDQVAVDRISGRLVHPASGRSYHKLWAPPKEANKDDVCQNDCLLPPVRRAPQPCVSVHPMTRD